MGKIYILGSRLREDRISNVLRRWPEMTSYAFFKEEIEKSAREYLNTQISDNEKLLWAGGTDIDTRMKKILLLVVICCLPLMTICSLAFLDNPDAVLIAVLSILLWSGLAIIIYFGSLYNYKNTIYAVTDQRLLLLVNGKPRKTRSFPPDQIHFLKIKKRKDSTGDLYFHRVDEYVHQEHVSGETRYNVGFEHIMNPEMVEDIIRKAFFK